MRVNEVPGHVKKAPDALALMRSPFFFLGGAGRLQEGDVGAVGSVASLLTMVSLRSPRTDVGCGLRLWVGIGIGIGIGIGVKMHYYG